MRLAFSNGPNGVGVPCSSPEGGNRSVHRMLCYSVFKKYWMLVKVQKLNNPNSVKILFSHSALSVLSLYTNRYSHSK
jgi:hypothetical protein